jgi:hypothetical protein
MVMRVRCAEDAGIARVLHTPVHTQTAAVTRPSPGATVSHPPPIREQLSSFAWITGETGAKEIWGNRAEQPPPSRDRLSRRATRQALHGARETALSHKGG